MTQLAVVLTSLAFPISAEAEKGWNAEIRAVDAEFRQAMIRGDSVELDRVIADDAKIIHGNHGAVQSKRELLIISEPTGSRLTIGPRSSRKPVEI
jgi:hypothetical protein